MALGFDRILLNVLWRYGTQMTGLLNFDGGASTERAKHRLLKVSCPNSNCTAGRANGDFSTNDSACHRHHAGITTCPRLGFWLPASFHGNPVLSLMLSEPSSSPK